MTPEEAARLKSVHDLCEQMQAIGPKFPDLTSWLGDEYRKYLEGRVWQRLFEPRRLSPPGGYHSPKNVPATMISQLTNMAMERDLNVPIVQTEIQAAAIYYEILRHQVPIYYVADSFIRAVAATELPKDFTLLDLHWPMPGMVLGFPVKFMKEYTGKDICYVYCADLADGVHLPPQWLPSIPLVGQCHSITTPAKVGIAFNAWDNYRMGSWVSAYLKSDRVDEALTKYSYTDFTFSDAKSVEDDAKLTRLMSSLVFKLLVVLNTRPALVEPGGMARKEKRNAKTGEVTQTELWNANIIGAKYRVLRAPGTGTHASPKWHWRRGHITHQRIGSHKSPDFVSIKSLPRREDGEIDWLSVPNETREAFWACHERKWLEPTLVNFDEDEKQC